MKKTARKTEVGEQYAAAHEAHYTTKDLAETLAVVAVTLLLVEFVTNRRVSH